MSFKFKKKHFKKLKPQKKKNLKHFIKKLKQHLCFSMATEDDIWKVKFIYLFISYIFKLQRFLTSYTILNKKYLFKYIWLDKFLNKNINFFSSKQFYYFYYTNFIFYFFFMNKKKKFFYLFNNSKKISQNCHTKKFIFKKKFLSLKIWKLKVKPFELKIKKNKVLSKNQQKLLINLFLLKIIKKKDLKIKLLKKQLMRKKRLKKLLKNVKKK